MSVNNLVITPGNTSLRLSWTNSRTNANAIIIKWMVSNNSVNWQNAHSVEIPSTKTSWNINSLVSGQTYKVQVSQVHFISSTEDTGTTQSGPPQPIVKPVIS